MEQKSKTEKKKEALLLQTLGEKLLKLSPVQIKEMDLPEEIRDAVIFAKNLRKKHGAFKRQMQFIGMLMRRVDHLPIQQALDNIEEGDLRKAEVFRERERLRDELAAGNKILLEKIIMECPGIDRQKLAQLIRKAGNEVENNKPHRASRALFRFLAQNLPDNLS